MSINNHEQVGRALDRLREGLRPFVEREFKAQFGNGWDAEIRDVLAGTRFGAGKSDPMGDVAAILLIMERRWREVFHPTLDRAERSLVNELVVVRNRWANQEPFSIDDTYRALDSAARLLKAVSALEADEIGAMKLELLRHRFGEAAHRATRPTAEPGAPAQTGPRFKGEEQPQPHKPSERHDSQPEPHTLSQADRIRQFALRHYVTPAHAAGQAEVTIRAGDVHKAMHLVNGMPAVCSAIGGGKFSALASVMLIERRGPPNGANAHFRFRLGPRPLSEPPSASHREPPSPPPISRTTGGLDFSDALVLVSCVKSKLPHAAPARELYTSAWFRKVRDLVETSGAPWFVLSARYGLVAPDEIIAPYDFTLYGLGTTERQEWAIKVLDKLLPVTKDYRRVILLAIARYCEFLVEPLQRHGLVVETPLAHLRRGEQLAWLSEHE